MMLRRLPLWFSAQAVVLATGCALAPGHHMDSSRIARDGSAESSQVELLPITPKLVAIDNASRQKAVIPAELLAWQPDTYRIGPSDVLFITVWDHPEITNPSGSQTQGAANGRYVRPDGTLFFPFVGNIVAAGKTIEELRTEISDKLTRYIDSPQVDVNVQKFASQQVLLSGAFKNTRPIPVTTKPLSLVEVIGVGGINTNEADLSALAIIREGHRYELNLAELTREPSELHRIFLKHGDTVDLPYNDNNKVYVMGEIKSPKALQFKADSMNLTDAIGSAGGLNQMTAKGQDVYVIRGVTDLSREKAKIFQLNARSPSAFILSGQFQLQPQDVVYIGPAGITRWNRLISQLLPSVLALGSTARTANQIENLNND